MPRAERYAKIWELDDDDDNYNNNAYFIYLFGKREQGQTKAACRGPYCATTRALTARVGRREGLFQRGMQHKTCDKITKKEGKRADNYIFSLFSFFLSMIHFKFVIRQKIAVPSSIVYTRGIPNPLRGSPIPCSLLQGSLRETNKRNSVLESLNNKNK